MNKNIWYTLFLLVWFGPIFVSAQTTFNDRYGDINYNDSSIYSFNNCFSVNVFDTIIIVTQEQRWIGENLEMGCIGIDYNGNELYSTLYGSDDAWWYLGHHSSTSISSDGHILETGSVDPVGDIIFHPSIFKFNQNGDTIWTREYPFFTDRQAGGMQIIETSGGDYFVTGFTATDTIDDNPQILVFKTDSDGNLLWSQEYGDPDGSAEYGFAVIENNDGGYFIGGAFQSNPKLL